MYAQISEDLQSMVAGVVCNIKILFVSAKNVLIKPVPVPPVDQPGHDCTVF